MSADDILSAIAPELDSVDPARRAIILDLADKQTSDDAFKESRDHYVAHNYQNAFTQFVTYNRVLHY